MSKTDSGLKNEVSRRKALTILGLAATVGYAAPTVLSLDKAEADDRSRSRSRSTNDVKPPVRNRSGRSRSRSRSRSR